MTYISYLTYISHLQYNRSETSPAKLSSQLLWNHPDHLKPTARLPGISSLQPDATILKRGHVFNLNPPFPEKGD